MKLNTITRRAAELVLPMDAFEKLQAIRSRRFQLKFLAQAGLLNASAKYIERNGVTVKHGPFTGMVYPTKATRNRHVIPKLLGTYEQELHGTIETIKGRKYDVVIDIGGAEGYYAVG